MQFFILLSLNLIIHKTTLKLFTFNIIKEIFLSVLKIKLEKKNKKTFIVFGSN